MKAVKIYTISDPDTMEVRYVGQTVVDLEKRLYQHCATPDNRGRQEWLLRVIEQAKMPLIQEIDNVLEDQAHEREKFWVRHYLENGHSLFNAKVIPYNRNWDGHTIKPVKIFHLQFVSGDVHKYYTSLQALFDDNEGELGISKFTLDRYDFKKKPFDNGRVIIRKGEAYGTGDVKQKASSGKPVKDRKPRK